MYLYRVGDSHSYSSLVNYLMGFEIGIKAERVDGLTEFDLWVRGKIGEKFALCTYEYILQYMCKGDENLAVQRLFELLQEFCQE